MNRHTPSIGLIAVLLLGACGSSGPSTPGMSVAGGVLDPVTFSVDWRAELVPQELFEYAPTQIGRVTTSPDATRVYVGTSAGDLFAINAVDGRVLWQRDMGEAIDAAPVQVGSRIFVGSTDGNFYGLSASSGSELWHIEVGGALDSQVAVVDDRLILARPDGVVVCLDQETGAVRWTARDNDPFLGIARGLYPPVKGQANPVVIDGVVYVGYPSGRLAALNLDDGQQVWISDLAGAETRHTDIDEPALVVGNVVYASSFSGGLFALDRETGNRIWHRELRGSTRPVFYQGQVLLTTVSGQFLSLDAETGDTNFAFRLQDQAPGRVYLIGDYALIPTSQGALYALGTDEPNVFARFRPTSGFASMTVGPNGRVYAFDNDGYLHGLTLRVR
ncbi:MAG: PQQ-binding-like beta-propeller repeat protein [Myxococcales bacterium]|nr:PQQ-binding-like beta-propeller repeat protein [Myxococcales bacterium]